MSKILILSSRSALRNEDEEHTYSNPDFGHKVRGASLGEARQVTLDDHGSTGAARDSVHQVSLSKSRREERYNRPASPSLPTIDPYKIVEDVCRGFKKKDVLTMDETRPVVALGTVPGRTPSTPVKPVTG